MEFTFAVFAFLTLTFGLVQVALIDQTQTALNQAASDAAFTLSAQSSDGNLDDRSVDADAAGLAAIRTALTGLNLQQISSIETFSENASDIAQSVPVTQSVDLNAGAFSSATCSGTIAHCITLDNVYGTSPGTGQFCLVDQFYLQVLPVLPTGTRARCRGTAGSGIHRRTKTGVTISVVTKIRSVSR